MKTQHLGSDKRRRSNQLIIRLTDSELSEFTRQMKKSKLRSRADFIMALVRSKPIIVPDGFKEIAVELRREGNNFNQLIRLMNSTGQSASSVKVNDSVSSLNSLYARLGDMLDGLNLVTDNADL